LRVERRTEGPPELAKRGGNESHLNAVADPH
jgi:hypothetical protein